MRAAEGITTLSPGIGEARLAGVTVELVAAPANAVASWLTEPKLAAVGADAAGIGAGGAGWGATVAGVVAGEDGFAPVAAGFQLEPEAEGGDSGRPAGVATVPPDCGDERSGFGRMDRG